MPSRPDGPRHRFDPSTLLAGLLFLGFAAWYGSAALIGYSVPMIFGVPCLLIGLATVGFVRVATRARRR
ncbi:MAG TPA: hypothetical protein VH912_02645 [Streptosporangiaceae bacterium]